LRTTRPYRSSPWHTANGDRDTGAGECREPALRPNLKIYRYATEVDSRRAETPQDNNDHALDALRYLVATIDQRKLGRKPKIGSGSAGEKDKPAGRPWLRLDNEALWTRMS
jgi:hypothetical protein